VKRSLTQFQCLKMSAAGTLACGALKPTDLQDGLAALSRDVLQNGHELMKRQIAHFTTPKRLHALQVQVFKAQHIPFVAQCVRQLKLLITPFVRHSNVGSTDEPSRFLAVIGAMRFLVFARLNDPQPPQSVEMISPRQVFFSGVVGEKSLQPKIEAREFTRRDPLWTFNCLHHPKKQPQPSSGIPFDGQRLDGPLYLTMLHVLVGTPADLNPMAVQQFPARRFEREGLALAHLLVFRRALRQVLEKAQVAFIQTFQNVLNCLRTELLPENIAGGFAPKFSDVRLEWGQRDVLSGETVVAFLQSQRMIPDRSGNVDLLVQILIALVGTIELVLVGSADSARIAHALTLFVGELVGMTVPRPTFCILAHLFAESKFG
jgi:hypothetical protein